MELKEVLLGKATNIKGVEYLSAKDYIQPFINRMDKLNATYVCKAKLSDQMSITNQENDIVYNKVHIQAILPKTYYNNNGYQKVVGLIYGLDVKTPCAKIYIADIKGDQLLLFDKECLQIQKLEDTTAIDFTCIPTLLSRTDINPASLDQIDTTIYCHRSKLVKKLGEWIDFTLSNQGVWIDELGKIKLSNTLAIDAYKLLIKDSENKHYITSEQEDAYYGNVYETFTDLLSKDSDFINRCEKILLIGKMLGLC